MYMSIYAVISLYVYIYIHVLTTPFNGLHKGSHKHSLGFNEGSGDRSPPFLRGVIYPVERCPPRQNNLLIHQSRSFRPVTGRLRPLFIRTDFVRRLQTSRFSGDLPLEICTWDMLKSAHKTCYNLHLRHAKICKQVKLKPAQTTS